MTDIRALGKIIIARVAAEVPELGGRVYDKATASVAYPYATIAAIYGVEADAECIDMDEWTVQLSIWDRETNKLAMGELAQRVRRVLKGWSDTGAVTMHPLSVQAPRIMDDPDGETVHAVLMIEAMVEG